MTEHFTKHDRKAYGDWPPPNASERVQAIGSRRVGRKLNNLALRTINRLKRKYYAHDSIKRIAGLSEMGVIERKPYTGMNRQQRKAEEGYTAFRTRRAVEWMEAWDDLDAAIDAARKAFHERRQLEAGGLMA